jgi:hypothetical protein
MNRLEKRHSVLDLGTDTNKSVLEICLDMKMNMNGSSNSLSHCHLGKYAEYLDATLETWEAGRGGLLNDAFDFAVRNLIIATLEMWASYHGNNFVYETWHRREY